MVDVRRQETEQTQDEGFFPADATLGYEFRATSIHHSVSQWRSHWGGG